MPPTLQRASSVVRLCRPVYAKTPLAGPAAVLDDLSRYTRRTAIGNERLLDITADKVRFKTRVNRKAAADPTPRSSVTTLAGTEFVSRLLQHVVPSGFKRIRHYGLLAPSAKAQRLATARALLGMPQANPATTEAVREFMQRVAGIDITRCPHCGRGRWQVLRYQVPPSPQACGLRLAAPAQACRGPPP